MKIVTDYIRNKNIVDEYVNGNLSMEQVGLKYNISRQQVGNIIARYKQLSKYAGFDVLSELTKFNSCLMQRLYNALIKWFGKDDFTVFEIMEIDAYEFSKLEYVGVSIAELFVEFKKELMKKELNRLCK